MYDPQRKSKKFKWTDEAEKAFKEIKELLINSPILRAPTPDGLLKNFGITELELTGLLVNIHGFMQLLHNRYFEVLVDHKAIEYVIKSKTETLTT